MADSLGDDWYVEENIGGTPSEGEEESDNSLEGVIRK